MLVTRLKLTDFRNIAAADLVADGAGAYVLVGPNGAGKTNLLEALSLLSPGQGLHRAKYDGMTRHGAPHWGLYAETTLGGEPHQAGMQYTNGKRTLRVDGDENPPQSALAALGAVVWLTPQMDRLFYDSPASRRRFIDRLTYGLITTHAGALGRYTHHLQARMRLLKDHADPDWLTVEEQQLAYWGTQVLFGRAQCLAALAPALADVTLTLSGTLEKRAEEVGAADMVAAYTAELAKNRKRDARFEATHFGPHRTDLTGTLHLEDGTATPLELTSMGQHKRTLLSILLAHAQVIKHATGHPPLMLLDEAAAHLDPTQRQRLYTNLLPLGCQLWLTGTEKSLFDDLPKARFIEVRGGWVF